MSGPRARRAGSLRGALLPLTGAAAIGLLDVAYRHRSWGAPVTALLDEPAHLLTAWLLWVTLAPRRIPRGFLPWVLVGAAAIDLDHLPLYLGRPGFLVDGGRPPTHSLVTVAVLALVALLSRRHRFFGGLAAGVLLHLVRDLATGPGVALGWPLVDASVRVPYTLYAAVVAAAALIAAVRGLAPSAPPHPSPDGGRAPRHLRSGDARRRSGFSRASPGDHGRVDQGSRPARARRWIRLPGRGPA